MITFIGKAPMKTENIHLNQTRSEVGSLRSLSLLLSILAIVAVKEHWGLIGESLPLYFQILLVAIVAMFAVCTILISSFSILSGEKSPRQMRKAIWKEQKRLREFIKEANTHVNQLKEESRKRSGVITSDGVEELALVQSLISSLEGRAKKVHEYQSYGDSDSVAYAFNLLFADVSPYDDAMNSLIKTSRNVSIPYENIRKDFGIRLQLIKDSLPTARQRRQRLATAH